MAIATLTTLPTEILVRICNLLHDSHVPSLEALSLGNKRCFEIAATVLANTITFKISTPAQLSEDVEKCKELLERHPPGLSHHVRRLVIVGCMDSPYCITGHGGANPIWEDTVDDSESEYDEDDPRFDRPVEKKKAKKPTFHFSLPMTTNWNVMHAQIHGFQFESEHGRGVIPLRRDRSLAAPTRGPLTMYLPALRTKVTIIGCLSPA